MEKRLWQIKVNSQQCQLSVIAVIGNLLYSPQLEKSKIYNWTLSHCYKPAYTGYQWMPPHSYQCRSDIVHGSGEKSHDMFDEIHTDSPGNLILVSVSESPAECICPAHWGSISGSDGHMWRIYRQTWKNILLQIDLKILSLQYSKVQAKRDTYPVLMLFLSTFNILLYCSSREKIIKVDINNISTG